MSEPDFIRQNGELKDSEVKDWRDKAMAEMRDQGAIAFQFSYHPTMRPKLWLLEGWKERPDDYGEPRFQFAAQPLARHKHASP